MREIDKRPDDQSAKNIARLHFFEEAGMRNKPAIFAELKFPGDLVQRRGLVGEPPREVPFEHDPPMPGDGGPNAVE